jgi:hypothetical protein
MDRLPVNEGNLNARPLHVGDTAESCVAKLDGRKILPSPRFFQNARGGHSGAPAPLGESLQPAASF